MGTPSHRVRIGAVALLAAALAIVAIGWSGPASSRAASQRVAKSVTVKTRKVGKLGRILVNSRGLTLYMFVRDHRKKVTCTSAGCTAIWPPLKLKKGQKATAAAGARKSLLGSDKSPKGYRVVTYNKWPLYTYITDQKPGQATGQGVNQSGGKWYVLSASGKVVKKHR